MEFNIIFVGDWIIFWILLSLVTYGFLKYRDVELSGWELFLLIGLCIAPLFGLIYMMVLLSRKRKQDLANTH